MPWRASPTTRRRGGRAATAARIEAQAPRILAVIARQPDITLVDLRSQLAGHGIIISIASLWRFFARRKIAAKKSPGMRRSRTDPTP